ncbi:ZYBA0S03-11188g1_1 [Zygosaccharomyces bailii CLIB 213]|uniref:Acyl-CoA desaturase n=1 Tax=Zygosaccharomyces bailii (strain CLIB 213 / ATCC 58445 / CBS 680 / BCRC 21525 / NBRC 1098 / NCYC 1416 / NRRL Y-2227) TaxID=1333698 RepID=A0A8J2T5W2_ZYGB2|nr:ZYBA0S03-11188g1_1 [Zygosaccharomyces bailii CLIB 213]
MVDGIPEFDVSDLITSSGVKSNKEFQESHVVPPDASSAPMESSASQSSTFGVSMVRQGSLPSTRKKKDPHIVHLLKRISLQSTILCILIPLFSLFKLIFAPPKGGNWLFLGFFCVYLFLSQIALFAGYHRFFSHQSFQAHVGLQLAYSVLGGSCGLGSVLQFSSQHMAHHRHQDTERDPHSYSVYGWLFSLYGHRLFLGNRKSRKAISECKDTILSTSKMVRGKLLAADSDQLIQPPNYEIMLLQDRNYVRILILTIVIIPCLVARYCQVPYWTGIYYLGFVRMSLIQQQWLLLGTLAHIKNFPMGTQPFSSIRSAINLPCSLFFQFILFGECNHNFHHEFPSDVTDGSKWYHWDPSKWSIFLCQSLGLVNHVHVTDSQQSEKCFIQQQQKLLDEERSKLKWGVSIDRLPAMTSKQFVELAIEQFVENQRALVVIEGIVHDVTPFIHDHPGGTALVQLSIGKDATQAFNGAVYSHSQAARNLLATMRIAKLSSNERVQNTVWERRMLKDSRDQQRRNNRQITYTQKNHYAAGAA